MEYASDNENDQFNTDTIIHPFKNLYQLGNNHCNIVRGLKFQCEFTSYLPKYSFSNTLLTSYMNNIKFFINRNIA
jgi:hypothetical protein